MKAIANRAKRGSRILYGFIQANINNKMGVIGPLHKLAISVTGKCNSRCITCNMWQLKPDKNIEIGLDDIDSLVQSKLYQNASVIIVTGGEPFIRKDIGEFIEILSQNTSGMVSIISNGLLSERVISTAT